MSEELIRRLDAFKLAMYDKFWARHYKNHPSVCDKDFDWPGDLDRAELEAHLREELQEWLKDGADRRAEAVDVANMMFLYWVVTDAV